MLATFDPSYTMVKWIAAGTFTVIGSVLLVIVYWMVLDFFRFGREGFAWMTGVGLSALFGSAACWLAGTGGLVFGVPFLVAFGVGKMEPGRDRNTNGRVKP